MKKRFKYEKPEMVDFRADSATGDYSTCYSGTNGYGDPYSNCNAGSCVAKSGCGTGEYATACYYGYMTCSTSSCYACCESGDVNMSPTDYCTCAAGTRAGWSCTTGNRDSGYSCSTGVYQSSCS